MIIISEFDNCVFINKEHSICFSSGVRKIPQLYFQELLLKVFQIFIHSLVTFYHNVRWF